MTETTPRDVLTPKFRKLLEEYHSKKWFPENYPDPYGEFIDSFSEDTVSSLFAAWQRDKRGSYLHVANYILQAFPEIRFREMSADYRRALADPIAEHLLPEFALNRIRNSTEQGSLQVWYDLQQWTDRWNTVLFDWGRNILNFETAHADFHQAYAQELQLHGTDESQLRTSRDLFSWQLQDRTNARDYRQFLRYFQFSSWMNVAPWNDVVAFSKAISETCGIPNSPLIKEAQNSAIQFLFPIQPPSRVILEHGVLSGPVDAMRFLVELGKGFFYTGMNPDLSEEERICGDPALPWFWGYLFASLLADLEGTKTFIGLKAEGLPQDAAFILQSWYRQDVMLSIYHNRAATDLTGAQELFAGLWELAFPIEPPIFLSLFELCRSTDSRFRSVALSHSQNVIKELRSKYGYRWFANRKWMDRARDYWREGFRLTTSDILADLQIRDAPPYPF